MIIKKRNFANAGFFFNTQRKELLYDVQQRRL
nr:MAG TPA: hypothetical protein [Caudoviricetes sp.]